MNRNVQVVHHKDTSTQSDFKDGAIDIQTSDPQACFALGSIFHSLSESNVDVVRGTWGDGMFIRVPVSPIPALEVTDD